MRRALVLGTGLIVVYLLVSHATEGGTLLTAGLDFLTGTVKVFQGR